MIQQPEDPSVIKLPQDAEPNSEPQSQDSVVQKKLATRFEEELEKNEPFYNDSFDPDTELQNISKLPKEKKRAAIETFKKRRARYKKALATMFEFLSLSVTDNPDVEKTILLSWLHKFAKLYSFGPEITTEFMNGIEAYYMQRQRLKDLMSDFKDRPLDLVERLTGYRVSEKQKHVIEKVELSIFSINIFCMGNTNVQYDLVQSINPKQIYSPFGSYAARGKNDPDIPINIMGSTWQNERAALMHEDQHQEVALMRKFFYTKPELSVQWTEYVDEKNPQAKQRILAEYMIEARDSALERFKNEIFAMTRGGQTVGSYENRFKVPGNSYDYLGYLRHFLKDPVFLRTSKKILTDEYYKIIDDAAKTLRHVTYRVSKKSAIALFHNIPVRKWKKEAKRLFVNDPLFK